MESLSIVEATSRLSQLVQAIDEGSESEITISLDGRPAARLVPVERPRRGARLGLAKGKYVIPDNIDNLNPEIEKLFSGAID